MSMGDNDQDVPVIQLTATPVLIAARTSGLKLRKYMFTNPNTGVVYVQVFDAALVANVTLGTTPPTTIIPLQAGQGANLADITSRYRKGIVVACTTTANGSTGPTTPVDGTISYQ